MNNLAFLVFIIVCSLSCTPSFSVYRANPEYSYTMLRGKQIAFSRPVVISSEITYANSYTDQNYHILNRQTTTDAFTRDFNMIVREKHLPWIFAGEHVYGLLEKSYANQTEKVLRISKDIQIELQKQSVDFFIMVYGVKMEHDQSVGNSENKGGQKTTSGTHLQRHLHYLCSIFNVATAEAVFFISIDNKQSGDSFSFMPDAINHLCTEILRSK